MSFFRSEFDTILLIAKVIFVGRFSWTITENLLVCGYDVSDVEVNTHVCLEA
jgi:hypothetical protein